LIFADVPAVGAPVLDLSEAISQIEALRAELHALRAENEALRAENEALRAENEALRAENEALRKETEALRKENAELKLRLEEAERAAHRPAAPFRVPESKRKSQPKKPGRKKGHRGSFRARPKHVDRTVEVPLDRCPQCGGEVSEVERVEQYIEEIPPVRPHVTHLVTHKGRCPECGPVRSTHPSQVSTATGAAGTHLGPRALGLAMELIHRHGLTRRKTCAVLSDLCGLHVTPGGLVQAAHRLAEKMRKSVEELIEHLRGSPVVHADETSWWVGGPKWWLWVFTRSDATLYLVRASRGRQVLQDTLGEDFPGMLVSDCLSVYDDATPLQHKCYAHHLKAIKEAERLADALGKEALNNLRSVLLAAMALKKEMHRLGAEEVARMRRALERKADEAIARALAVPAAAKTGRRFEKQRDHLFAFLDEAEAEATNNLAERQLRPAVIARKVSCGNKTERGADTWQTLTSLSVTAHQRGESFLTRVAQALAPP